MGGCPSRNEDQLVSRYKRAWCIQVLLKDIKEGAVIREKEKSGQEIMHYSGHCQEGGSCVGGSSQFPQGGSLLHDPDSCPVLLSLSTTMNGKVVACSRGCQAFLDTGSALIYGSTEMVTNIHKLMNARPEGSEVKGHATGSLPVSPHNKDPLGQPLSFSLTVCGFM